MRKTMEVKIAKLMNVKYNSETGEMFLEMKVTDPVWKQKLLKEWQELNVKLVIDEEQL